jgi:predicted transcriptional regulator of viral defense system
MNIEDKALLLDQLIDVLGKNKIEELIGNSNSSFDVRDQILQSLAKIQRNKLAHSQERMREVTTEEQLIIDQFIRHNGILDAEMLNALDIDFYHVRKLESKKLIHRIKRGVYCLVSDDVVPDELVEVAHLIPKGVFYLYSALTLHELTDYNPDTHHIAIPRTSRYPSIPDFPPIKVYRVHDNLFDLGIEEVQREGHTIRVYNKERTVCDVIKYRGKLDSNVVKEVLHSYMKRNNKRDITRLYQYAEELRVKNILNNLLEVL